MKGQNVWMNFAGVESPRLGAVTIFKRPLANSLHIGDLTINLVNIAEPATIRVILRALRRESHMTRNCHASVVW